MDEESLEVKSPTLELRDLIRWFRMLPEREPNTDREEGSSPTGVPGRLSGVGDVGQPNPDFNVVSLKKTSSKSSPSCSANVLSGLNGVLVCPESADGERRCSLCGDNGMMASAELSVLNDAKLATDPLGKS